MDLVAQIVKNLPAVQEICIRSLGQEEPLKKGATHSSIPAWRIPWIEEPGGLPPMGDKDLDMTEQLSFSHFWIVLIVIIKMKPTERISK